MVLELSKELMNANVKGFIVVKDANVQDRSYSSATNTVGQFLDIIQGRSAIVPFTSEAINAFATNATMVTNYAAIGLSLTDLLCVVHPTFGFSPYASNPCPDLLGAYVTQRFTGNAVSSPYSFKARYIVRSQGVYGVCTDLNRDLQVEPTQGANTSLEFVFFNMGPAIKSTTDNATHYTNTISGLRNGYLTPLRMVHDTAAAATWLTVVTPIPGTAINIGGGTPVVDNFADGVVELAMIFTNQGSVTQTTSVLPFFCGFDAPYQVSRMMGQAFNDYLRAHKS